MSNEAQPVSAEQIEAIRAKSLTYAGCSDMDVRALLRAIDERNAQLQLLREAITWILDNGVIKAIHHINGKPCPRLVDVGDFDSITPPAHLGAVLAEVTGEK